jgi:hypothetical protein
VDDVEAQKRSHNEFWDKYRQTAYEKLENEKSKKRLAIYYDFFADAQVKTDPEVHRERLLAASERIALIRGLIERIDNRNRAISAYAISVVSLIATIGFGLAQCRANKPPPTPMRSDASNERSTTQPPSTQPSQTKPMPSFAPTQSPTSPPLATEQPAQVPMSTPAP